MASAVTRTDFFLLAQPGAPGGVECRMVWPNLAKKRTTGGTDGKTPLKPEDQYYDCTLLIPKTHANKYECANLRPIVQRMGEILQARKEWGGQWPARFTDGITDCDRDGKWPDREWAQGHWAISPWSSSVPPRVVDQGNNDMAKSIDGEYLGLKSGDYVLVSINAFGWGVPGPMTNCGISYGLEAVKKARDGDPVGSAQRAVSEIFGAPTGVPVQPAGAPPLPGGFAAPPMASPGGFTMPVPPMPQTSTAPPQPQVATAPYLPQQPATSGYVQPLPMPGSPVAMPPNPTQPPVAPPAYIGGPPQPQVGYAPQPGAPSPYPPQIGGR